MCSVGVELELSGSSDDALGIAILDTGNSNPEISVYPLALIPLSFTDGAVDGLSNVGVLLGLVGSKVASVISHLIEIPAVEFVEL